jgi:predicted ATPase
MYTKHLVIRNFRALEDIQFDLVPRANVIVGPNAVGKTTILQALRLVKSLLAARTQQEAQQTLISLGAASPHFPNRIATEALARDPSKPLEIRASIVFAPAEAGLLRDNREEIARNLAVAQLGLAFQNPANLIQFFASPQGKLVVDAALQQFDQFLQRLDEGQCTLGITLDPDSGQITPVDPLAGVAVAFIDAQQPPLASVFSYFPADRSLPVGEVPVQVGGADIAQQIESHNSQPQLKFTRLKTMLFNTIGFGEGQRESFREEFERIFNGILRGKEIGDFKINEIGLLSVYVRDKESGRVTEIDSLSSGEKNLILTFLLIAKTVSNEGMVLFDEPELHLNPSVCKEILAFLMSAYGDRKNIQFIICTHSPEILTSAFDADGCALFHLKTPSNISRVGPRALGEYEMALQKLGTSVGETLLYEGTVLVEGDDDVDFLRNGFDELTRKYNVKDRGGRREVEKTAKKLQELEAKGEKVSPIFIILDRDDEIANIASSPAVRILQWKRRCVENYLLDVDVVAEIFRDDAILKKPITDSGEVERLLQNLALQQLPEIAAREVYGGYGFLSPSLRSEDIEGKSQSEISGALYDRMQASWDSMPRRDRDSWIKEFDARLQTTIDALKLQWEPKWIEVCDGKRLLKDLQKLGVLKVSTPNLKRRIIQRMKETQSDSWRLAESQLCGLLGKA